MERVFEGILSEVCVSHRDRLSRFGFEIREWTLEKHNCKLVREADGGAREEGPALPHQGAAPDDLQLDGSRALHLQPHVPTAERLALVYVHQLHGLATFLRQGTLYTSRSYDAQNLRDLAGDDPRQCLCATCHYSNHPAASGPYTVPCRTRRIRLLPHRRGLQRFHHTCCRR